MPVIENTKNGWVVRHYIFGYDDDFHEVKSPAFRSKEVAEKYAIDEMGLQKCDFCNHLATRHYNSAGNKLEFGSMSFPTDYYTCDECIHKVNEHINWIRNEREKKLVKKISEWHGKRLGRVKRKSHNVIKSKTQKRGKK